MLWRQPAHNGTETAMDLEMWKKEVACWTIGEDTPPELEKLLEDAADEIDRLSRQLAEAQRDLRLTLRSVLHLYGPEGANKVTSLALHGRDEPAHTAAMGTTDEV